MFLLQDPFNHCCDLYFFSPGGLIVAHFKQQPLYSSTIFKETRGTFLCVRTCLLKLQFRGEPPLLLTFIVMQPRFIIWSAGPWVTSHLSEHCGPPLSLYGSPWPLFTGHTHTNTQRHTLEIYTPANPNQITALPSSAVLLCDPFVLQVSFPRVKRWANSGKRSNRGETLLTRAKSTTIWPQRRAECDLKTIKGKINIF